MQFFLDAAEQGAADPNPIMNFISNFGGLLILIPLGLALYFFMIRPQRKKEKEETNMRNSLEIGDEIVTIGGIIGQVVRIKGETITIATGKDRTTMRLLRSAIREVTVKINAPEPADTKAASKETPNGAPPKKDESDKPAKAKKPAKEKKSKKVEAPIEEAPAAEVPVEEAPAAEETKEN